MSEHTTIGPAVAGAARPRLLDAARQAIRRRHYSYRTEETYLHWMKRFILFSGKRHPGGLGAAEVTAFLNHLAQERHVAAPRTRRWPRCFFFIRKFLLSRSPGWTVSNMPSVRYAAPRCSPKTKRAACLRECAAQSG